MSAIFQKNLYNGFVITFYHSKYFPLFPLLIFAFLLRLPLLSGSFWLDEAAQALESTRPLSQQLDIVADFQPPLLHLITHFASYVSVSEWWLRTIGALIPGLLTIAALYFVLLRAGGQKAAIIGSLLLATSSLHVFFSQELRPYALPAAFAALSWLMLYEKKWLLFGLCTILGLYSSYLYPFLLLTQLIWQVFVAKTNYKQFVMTLLAAAALFLPWLPMFFAQLQAGQLLRHDLPGWESVVSIPQEKAIQLVLGKFIFGMSNLSFSLMYVLIAGVLLGAITLLVIYFWPKLPAAKQRILTLFLLWAFLPLLLSWLASWFVPVVQPKRLLLSLPGFYGVVSILYIRATKQKNSLVTKAATGLVALLFVLNAWSLSAYYSDAKLQREDWRDIISQIENTYPKQKTLAVFIFPEPFAPWRWYADPRSATLSTRSIFITDATLLRETLEPALDYSYVVVFDYLQDLTDPNRLVLLELQKFGFRETGSFSAENVGFVRIFSNTKSLENQG